MRVAVNVLVLFAAMSVLNAQEAQIEYLQAVPYNPPQIGSEALQTRADRDPADDSQDFIILAPERPVLVRMHLSIEGEPFRGLWPAYLDRIHEELDVNKDGALSREEAMRAPNANALNGNVQQFPGGPPVAPALPNPDTDGNGDVSREELAAYIASTYGANPLTIQPVIGSLDAERRLLERIDRNADGTLSADEIAAVEDSLRLLDLNDDDVVSMNELTGAGQNPFPGYIVFDGGLGGFQASPQPAAPSVPVMLGREDLAPEFIAQTLLQTYDGDSSGTVGRDEWVQADAAFDRLDADGDGQLTAEELAAFAAHEPELVVRFAAGPIEETDAQLVLEGPLAENAQVAGGTVQVAGARISFHVEAAMNGGMFDSAGNLGGSDFDGSGYLTPEEVAKRGNIYGVNFSRFDANGDLRITPEEERTFFRRLREPAATHVDMAVQYDGRALFGTLDANHDGRLSLRELQAASEVLDPYDADGDGSVGTTELPINVSFRMQRRRGLAMAISAPVQPGVNYVQQGPDWFQHMDRNRDGELSPREFLGPMEAFERLDADSDGFVSAREATRAEQQ